MGVRFVDPMVDPTMNKAFTVMPAFVTNYLGELHRTVHRNASPDAADCITRRL